MEPPRRATTTDPMSQTTPRTSPRGADESSPAARNLSEWFRQLDRWVRMVRTFGAANPNTVAARERLLEDFLEQLGYHAPFTLHVTPLEIFLRDEAIVRPPAPGSLESRGNVERRLPFLLYRDGIRDLTFAAEATRTDVGAFLDALARVATSRRSNEDLVTLLWEADLSGLRVDVAPVEQHFRVDASAGDAGPAAEGSGSSGEEATSENREVTAHPADPLSAWRELAAREGPALGEFRAAWDEAQAAPWTSQVPEFLNEVTALDPGLETTEALGRSVVGWLGSAVQRCAWNEAAQAIAALEAVDPGGRTAERLREVLGAVDPEAVAERLDESPDEEQALFFALGVRAGRPALDLLVGVLAIATRSRLRAAATTALAYLCADEPRLLAPHLADERWYVVRNVAFVLGQIGGPEAAELLAAAARHVDARVRRTVVHALGQVPVARRTPLLLGLLESTDAQTVSATLAMLSRDADRRVIAALLERVTAPEFESRPDEVKFALVSALGDAGGGEAVKVLEQVLQKGGWFARRTPERTAAALALARIGSPAAIDVLQAGLRSRSEAIRASCQEALARKERVA